MKAIFLVTMALTLHAAHAQTKTYPTIFDYCAAVRTEARDPMSMGSVTGPAPIQQAMKAFDAKTRDDIGVAEGYSLFVWRCSRGRVLACAKYGGRDGYCQRADISQIPTRDISVWCRQNRNQEMIPLAVTGHRSMVYEFTCRQGVATATNKLFTPDEDGFQPDQWREVGP